jgi:hypothetical protein
MATSTPQMYTKKSHPAKELIENNKLLQNLTPRIKSNKSFNYCQLYLNKHANEMSCSGGICLLSASWKASTIHYKQTKYFYTTR